MGTQTRPSRGGSTPPPSRSDTTSFRSDTTSSRPTTTARLEIDGHACVRSGVCSSLAPHRFELTGDRTVIIDDAVDETATGADAEAVADAIACCPVAAIMIVDHPGVVRTAQGRP